MDKRIKEAIRYLGYGKQAIDEPTLALIQDSFAELEKMAEVKFVYRIFELSFPDTKTIQVMNFDIQSIHLVKNLYGCKSCIIFGITLGAMVDRVMQKYERTNIAKAVVFQACAAAYLEEACDKLQEKWAEELKIEGKYIRPRFSPGYGDFSILYQKNILALLDAPKRIGLTSTESFMMTPTKSVTAIIGISDTNEKCHRDGCEVCEKLDCIYRRS